MNEKQEVQDQDNVIKQKYDALFFDENWHARDENSFLNALIDLESTWKIKLFRTLLGGDKTNGDKTNEDKTNEPKTKEEVRQYLKETKRKELEEIISEKYLWKKKTIVDIIDEYSNMIQDTFKTKPIMEAFDTLWIKYQKIHGKMILPWKWNQRLQSWDGKWLELNKTTDKFNIFFTKILTIENGIYPWDYEVIIWDNEKNAVRRSSYVVVRIEKENLKKTIFINNNVWEWSFVYDGIIWIDEIINKSKKEFGKEFKCVNYSEDKKNQRELRMMDLIFWSEKWSQKFVRDALMDENGELTEKWKEWFGEHVRNKAQARERFYLPWVWWYITIARIFWFTSKNTKESLFSDNVFYQLSKAIFWEKSPNSKKEKIRKELIELKDKRFSLLNSKDRQNFKIKNWPWYHKILRIFWINEPDTSFETFCKISEIIFSDDEYKEDIEKLKKLKEEKEQDITAEEIINIYNSLDDESKKRFKSSQNFNDNKEKIIEKFGKWMPKSRRKLIKLLGGDALCKSLWYEECQSWKFVEALLISKEEWKKYLEENCTKIEDLKPNLSAEEIKEKYKNLTKEQQSWFSLWSVYKAHKWDIENLFNWKMPSWSALINLLGWNEECQAWQYMVALLNDEWETYYYNREQRLEQKLSAEEIRERYRWLPDEQKTRFASSSNYQRNINNIKEIFGEWMPNSWCGFIWALDIPNLCKSLWYKMFQPVAFIQAVLHSKSEWEKYLKQHWEKLALKK